MMDKIFEINCLTGEANERPMNSEEIKLVEKIKEAELVSEKLREQRKTDRQNALDKLGLTSDEVEALFG